MRIVINKSKFSVIEDYLYFFLLIFGLTLPVIRTSSYLLYIFIPLRLFLNLGGFSSLKLCLHTSYFSNIFKLYVLLVLYTCFVTIVHLQFDFSLIPTLVNVVIHLFACLLFVSLLICKKRNTRYVYELMINIFLIQSIIEICAYLNPNVLGFVQKFQSNTTVELASQFSGRRGLALAGTVFFGLSSTFGLIFIIINQRFINLKQNSYKYILITLLIFIGAFFTGRTFFVGLGIGLLMYYLSSIPKKIKLNYTIKIIFIFIALLLIIISILPEDLYNHVSNLIWYVFEAAYNYVDYGTLSTSSSDTLMNDMYFPISLSTFFCGDGIYTGYDGAYYMHTDSGYMRNILYGGIICC